MEKLTVRLRKFTKNGKVKGRKSNTRDGRPVTCHRTAVGHEQWSPEGAGPQVLPVN